MSSTFEGSRTEVCKAVRRVAHAQGRTQTMDRLDDLVEAAQAWRRVLAVDPKIVDMVEAGREREFQKAA